MWNELVKIGILPLHAPTGYICFHFEFRFRFRGCSRAHVHECMSMHMGLLPIQLAQ